MVVASAMGKRDSIAIVSLEGKACIASYAREGREIGKGRRGRRRSIEKNDRTDQNR